MPPRTRGGKGKEVSRDSLDVLPDDVLQHVLSFLPAPEAVRTCVLARRWQHLWRSATGLRIECSECGRGPLHVDDVREFVDNLLLLRGGSPLDRCEITLYNFSDPSHVNLWIRHILLCKVRALILDLLIGQDLYQIYKLTLVSEHLKTLQLTNLEFNNEFLDFSCCPALEVLEIKHCDFSRTDRISSQSLKCLSICNECYFSEEYRFRICAPNLHSLRLEVGRHRTPALERMPSLVEAFVDIVDRDQSIDSCNNAYSGDCGNEDCFACYGIDGDTNKSVLLQGLSEARNLSLISDIKMFLFRRDLKRCPIFGNLKTLLLNEYWCVPADFSALAYMLEHSPILEKLTLQLFCEGPESKVQMKGIPDPTGRSASMSKYLKIVEVKCEVVDDRVLDVLKFLDKLGIYTYRFLF